MKLFIFLTTVAFTSADRLDKTYLPPNSQSSGGSGSILRTPLRDSTQLQGQKYSPQNGNQLSQIGNAFAPTGNGLPQNGFIQNGAEYKNGFNNNFGNYESRPERTQAAYERNAAVLRQDNSNDGETYAYAYETENGIFAEENGVATNGVEAQGGYTYTGDDGNIYTVRYTADQNGFVPQGDHLPTPPPVPEDILRALEQNARDEAAGIYDDGSYSEAKYGDEEARYNAQKGYGTSYPTNNNKQNDVDTVVTNSAIYRGTQSGGSVPVTGSTGFGNAATFSQDQKAYLPPFANQRAFGPDQRNGFGSRARQPTYSARDGYKY